jgi:hypothetical protein
MFGYGGSIGGMFDGIIPSKDEFLKPEGFYPSI